MAATSPIPYRQIRATYDQDTITVYQAYKSSIADAAVKHQKLSVSPDFKPGRMTWVKPSWAWMMYRAGYSYKDAGQERILALKMKHEYFLALLRKGVLYTHNGSSDPSAGGTLRDKTTEVRIQWDPERDAKLGVLPYRSIQIGIPASLSGQWAEDWVVAIEDVTDTARRLKAKLDEHPDITDQELQDGGLVPNERVFDVPDDIVATLKMKTGS